MDFEEFYALLTRVEKAMNFIKKYKDIEFLVERVFRLENFLKTYGDMDELINHFKLLEKHIYLQKEYLTVEETADYIHQSVGYVYSQTQKRTWPLIRPSGKTIYIKKEDINEWFEEARLMSSKQIKLSSMKRVMEMQAERDAAMATISNKKEKNKGKRKAKDSEQDED